MENSIFESAVRTSGDLAAVFERDRDGGYFYLFDVTKEEGQQALAAFEVNTDGELNASDISVRWNASEEFAGLFIGGSLRAAYDQYGRTYGGNGADPSIPLYVIGQLMPAPDNTRVSEREIPVARR